MNVTGLKIVDGDASALTLTSALLIYSGAGGAFATAHKVQVNNGKPTLLAGRAVTKRGVRDLARALGVAPKERGFIPANLLYETQDRMAWWVQPQQRRVWFKCAEVGGERSAVVPQPGLVFMVGSDVSWHVWALAGAARPDRDTPLFQAPYLNTYKDGSICVGSAKAPNTLGAESMPVWEQAFYDSQFTHANAGELVNHPGGALAFWKAMLDAPPAVFPNDALVPYGKTLAQAIEKAR